MLMLALVRYRSPPPIAAVDAQSGHLAAGALASTCREPLVHDTGVFVFAQVQAFENSVGKALCPMRLLRRLRSLVPLTPSIPTRNQRRDCHDPSVPFPAPRPAGRRHLQRRLGRRA